MSYRKTKADVQGMFGAIAPRYDRANRILSGGIDLLWRRALLKLAPRFDPEKSDPPLVLDLCTGTGDLLPLLRERFGLTVFGADFCLPMLQEGKACSYPRVQADALNLPFASDTFDLVTVAFGIRNFENLENGLREIKRVLKPDGMLLVLEFGRPHNRLFRALYQWYSARVIPSIGAILTGNRDAYLYLPESVAVFPYGEVLSKIAEECGLSTVKFSPLTGGIAYRYAFKKCAKVISGG